MPSDDAGRPIDFLRLGSPLITPNNLITDIAPVYFFFFTHFFSEIIRSALAEILYYCHKCKYKGLSNDLQKYQRGSSDGLQDSPGPLFYLVYTDISEARLAVAGKEDEATLFWPRQGKGEIEAVIEKDIGPRLAYHYSQMVKMVVLQ